MKIQEAHGLAHGRVWLGTTALKNHLVDRQGGVLEALMDLLENIGAPESFPPELVYLPTVSLSTRVMSGLGLATMVAEGHDDDIGLSRLWSEVSELTTPKLLMLAPTLDFE